MKIFIASFNRASDGAISKLVESIKYNKWYIDDYEKADYILACGDRTETFDFVLERFRENKKIIHLWAGEKSCWATHDDVYRHAITLMSMMQLCTNKESLNRTNALCESVGKISKSYVIGNVMLDNMEIDETNLPKYKYDLILYNPPVILSEEEIKGELKRINSLLNNKQFIWIETNGDKYSDLVTPYVTHKSLPRPQFLGLLKNCERFINNSSCQYYEAQFLLKPEQIISIGKRNKERESKYSDMTIPNAGRNIVKIFNGELK